MSPQHLLAVEVSVECSFGRLEGVMDRPVLGKMLYTLFEILPLIQQVVPRQLPPESAQPRKDAVPNFEWWTQEQICVSEPGFLLASPHLPPPVIHNPEKVKVTLTAREIVLSLREKETPFIIASLSTFALGVRVWDGGPVFLNVSIYTCKIY